MAWGDAAKRSGDAIRAAKAEARGTVYVPELGPRFTLPAILAGQRNRRRWLVAMTVGYLLLAGANAVRALRGDHSGGTVLLGAAWAIFGLTYVAILVWDLRQSAKRGRGH